MAYESHRQGYAGKYIFGGWDVGPLLEADYASQSAFGHFRQEIRWLDIEKPSHPGFDADDPTTWNWSALTNPINRVIGWGFAPARIYLQITTVPSHRRMRAGGNEYTPPASMTAYGNFLTELYARAGPLGIRGFEDVNEPNIFRDTGVPLATRQQKWADMTVQMGTSIRAAAFAAGGNSERNAIYIYSGGLANAGSGLGSALDWLNAAVAHNSGFLAAITQFGYHPYGLIQRLGGPTRDGVQFPNFTVLDPTRASSTMVAICGALHNRMTALGYPNIPLANTETGMMHHPWAITGHGLAMTTFLDDAGQRQYGMPIKNPRSIAAGNPLVLDHNDDERMADIGPNPVKWYRHVASEAEAAWLLDRAFCWWWDLALPSLASHPTPVDQVGTTALTYPRSASSHSTIPRGIWSFYRHIDLPPSLSPEEIGQHAYMDIGSLFGTYTVPDSTPSPPGPSSEALKRNPAGGDDVLSWIRRAEVPNTPTPPPPPPTVTLAVALAGGGEGRVTSSVHGGNSIDTGAVPPRMSVVVATGTIVTLTADPEESPADTFDGWSGGVPPTATNPLAVTVNANLSVTATFSEAAATTKHMGVGVTPASPPGGRLHSVSPAGIDTDAGDNAEDWAPATVVTLQATPRPTYLFSQFTGSPPDAGTAGPIRQWTMNAPALIQAVFVQPPAPGEDVATLPLPVGWGHASADTNRPYGPVSYSGPAPAAGAPRLKRYRVVFPANLDSYWMWTDLDMPDDYKDAGAIRIEFEFSVQATAGNVQWRAGLDIVAPGTVLPTYALPAGVLASPIAPPAAIGATTIMSIVLPAPSGAVAGRPLVVWIGRVGADPSTAQAGLEAARLIYEVA